MVPIDTVMVMMMVIAIEVIILTAKAYGFIGPP